MRYSKAFIPTLKEAPKEATSPSHVLLLRAGYARAVGAGMYELLPLGLRVLHKIVGIVRAEMDRAGAQELLLPALLPSDYFKESGRWDSFGPTLFRLQDRKGGDYHLGPTHEEIITDLARREIHSYRQLPVNLYQIQTKFRDEPRPRGGLLRCREFIMKDAYSFDRSEADAQHSYETMRQAYGRMFGRMGLDHRVVQAHSGAMGGSTSAEFQVLASTGEDAIVACTDCDYAANLEVAVPRPPEGPLPDPNGQAALERVATPGQHTIGEVSRFLAVPASQTLKALIYVVGDRTVMAVVRGDHDVNETALASHFGEAEAHLASDAEVQRVAQTPPGFVGPVGFSGSIVADRAVAYVQNAVCGANVPDHHLRNVNHGRDFQAELIDLRQVREGDRCPHCGGLLKGYRGIEGGHIFILGTHYSVKMGATFLDEDGQQAPLVMGCYGIGVSRLLAAVVEQHHDDDGIRWPLSVAPYHVLITPIGRDEALHRAAGELYEALQARGVEVLLDDRDERPGVKFKDADLLGVPLRLTLGAKSFAAGTVELKRRGEGDVEAIALDRCVDEVCDRVVRLGGQLRSGGAC